MSIREHLKQLAPLYLRHLQVLAGDMPPVNDLLNPYATQSGYFKMTLDGNGDLPAQSTFTQMGRVFGLLSAVAAISMRVHRAP